MSWESSIEYERIINTETQKRLGGVHSADLIIRSYDFGRIEHLQEQGRWDEAGDLLSDDALRLQAAGAGCIVLCTNTMHRVSDHIESAVEVPFLHIADATAAAIKRRGLGSVGLLGTRYTMEEDFYRGRLEEKHDLEVVVPDRSDRATVHQVIYSELVKGVIEPASKRRYLKVIDRLTSAGVEGIIAGCTEIELLVGPEDVDVPYFPTTRLHALAAVDWSLQNDGV